MDFFLKHKIILLRTSGIVMLIVAFAIHFWVTPKEALSESEKAQARIERMEASARGGSASSISSQADTSKFLEKMKATQAKQIEYMTILAMLFGIGFVGYSFFSKPKES